MIIRLHIELPNLYNTEYILNYGNVYPFDRGWYFTGYGPWLNEYIKMCHLKSLDCRVLIYTSNSNTLSSLL